MGLAVAADVMTDKIVLYIHMDLHMRISKDNMWYAPPVATAQQHEKIV